MKINNDKVSEYLRYGFIADEFDYHPTVQHITTGVNNRLTWTLESHFENALLGIDSYAKEYNRRIYLSLSGWVDSMLIYKFMQNLGIDFQPITVSYWSEYCEVEQIKNLTNDDPKIQYINSQKSSDDMLNFTWQRNFWGIVSHPTIMAYDRIASNIEKNSILLTWDLWDEIFWTTESDLQWWEALPEYVFSKEELWKCIVELDDVWSDMMVCSPEWKTEVYTLYRQVTYKMWEEVCRGNAIAYTPFYAVFLNYLADIKKSHSSKDKRSLMNLAKSQWIDESQFCSAWMKYPVIKDDLKESLDYIRENTWIMVKYWLNLNVDFLEHWIHGNTKQWKWKIFSIMMLINYMKHNDNRFFENS